MSSTSLIEASEAARRVGVPSSTVQRWLRTGKTSGTKYGRSWLLDQEDQAQLRRLAESRGRRA